MYCVYIYIYACMYVCMSLSLSLYIYIKMMYIYIYIYMHVYMCDTPYSGGTTVCAVQRHGFAGKYPDAVPCRFASGIVRTG